MTPLWSHAHVMLITVLLQAFMLKRQAWEHAAQAPGAEPVDAKVELDKWGRKYRESLARVS